MNRSQQVDRVLIVEDWAHRHYGHFPNRFAELADGFVAAGIPVEVLTARGWLHEGTRPRRWPLHRYGSVATVLVRLAFALEFRSWVGKRRLLALAPPLRTLAAIIAATARARTMDRAGAAGRTGVVLLNSSTTVRLIAKVVRRPWLIHRFDEPPAGAARDRRRTRYRSVALAMPTAAWKDAAIARMPDIRTVLVRLAGTRSTPPHRPNAKAVLGLQPNVRVALLFGTNHHQHDPAPVVHALAGKEDWQLLAVGTICELVAQCTDTGNARWPVSPVLIPGTVDAETRDLAYAAADVVMLSFTPDYELNSGTLMDALSCRRPVVVSDRSRAADLVERHGVGQCFRVADSSSVIDALDRVVASELNDCAFGQRIDQARAHFANDAIARAHFEVLQRLDNPHDDLSDWSGELRP